MTNKYNNVYISDVATVAGKIEGEGPLNKYFSYISNDEYESENTFEQAETKMMKMSIELIKKQSTNKNINLFIAGDLLNQIIASNVNALNLNIPYLGVYNACATSVESMIIASNFLENSKSNNILCSTSSHNCSAEKQFRYPNEYGSPKPIYSTYTSTGGASILLSNEKNNIKVTSSTIGSVVDLGMKDTFNMGAVMAPAAAKTIYTHLKNLKLDPSYYDLILTGDLGLYGKKIFLQYMKEEYKIEFKDNYNDCGVMLYNLKKQDVKSGGSGPVCAPLVVYSYVMEKLKTKELKKVLICATGSLHSPTLTNQKLTIPSIAHAISLEVVE